MLGVIDDVARRTPSGFGATPGETLLPARRRPATSSTARRGPTSCTATSAACRRRSTWRAERLLGRVLIAGSRDGLIAAAHDLSDGGLAQALVESLPARTASAPGSGSTTARADGWTRSPRCSRESTARALVAVPRSEELRFTDMCAARGLPVARIGVWTASAALEVQGQFAVPLAELRAAHEAPLPALFGH